MTPRHAHRTAAIALAAIAIAAALIAGHRDALGADTWNGLAVAPEHRCSPYDRSDYRYPQSIEAGIVASMGGRVYGPYTGRHFRSTRQTDIEHIVAVSEAHDSGLCATAPDLRRRFASDPLNLILAAPEVNRCAGAGKCAHDPAKWLPPMNRCWFAARVVDVKRKYRLTVDRREAAALDRVLSACTSTDLVFTRAQDDSDVAASPPNATASTDALALYDDNGNGRITCREARRHGIAPVPRGHPAYRFMRDGDGDGVVCE